MLIYEVPTAIGLGELEDRLFAAFESILAALQAEESVVIAVDDRDLQGVGDVADAALAHGLLGICRALALEGAKEGWMVSVLASSADVDAAERARWISELGRPGAASGALVRLGGGHLGKLPT